MIISRHRDYDPVGSLRMRKTKDLVNHILGNREKLGERCGLKSTDNDVLLLKTILLAIIMQLSVHL